MAFGSRESFGDSLTQTGWTQDRGGNGRLKASRRPRLRRPPARDYGEPAGYREKAYPGVVRRS
jgi:hypothetical protein